MSEKRSYDAIIVGGGVIGLACAWRLAQRGADVAVLEREPRAPAGATRVAAGMLAPVGELTFGEPDLLELTLVAAELYPGFVAELEGETGLATGYDTSGALHVALDRDEAAAAAPRPRPAAQDGPRGRVARPARLPRARARR